MGESDITLSIETSAGIERHSPAPDKEVSCVVWVH